MKEYHKIETLFKFNPELKKFERRVFYNPTVSLLANHLWHFTEKIDGTNFRIYWDGHSLSYGGRTNKATFSKQQIEYIEKFLVTDELEIQLEQMFKEKEVYIFGELYGKNIQRNGKMYSENYEFKVFDVMVNDIYLQFDNAVNVTKELGLKFVPDIMLGTINDGIEYVESHIKSVFSDAPLEGLVGKPVGDLRDRLGKRIIVKIKKRDLEKSI